MWDRSCTDCICPVPSGWRAAFDVDASHVFPQGMLATITLVRGGTGDGGARAVDRYETRLLLCSVAITALSGVGSDPKLVEQKP